MAQIRDYDQLSETAKWIIISALDFVSGDIWPEDGRPDFRVIIGDEEVDATEFFVSLAEKVDAEIEHHVEARATAKFNDAFDTLFDELEEERENLVNRFKDLLRRVA